MKFAAVQYTATTRPIIPLTTDVNMFIFLLSYTVFQRGEFSLLAGGLHYCVNQFLGREGEPNKIVLLEEGRTNIGRSPHFIAEQFQRNGGSISAVRAGFSDDEELFAITGDPSQVFRVNALDIFDLNDIIGELVTQLCRK